MPAAKYSKASGARRWWTSLLKRWKASDLPVEEFCIQHNLSVEKFLYWQDQITRSEKAALAPSRTVNELFVPVQVSKNATRPERMTVEDVTATASDHSIEIVVAGGRFILRLSENFHSGKLYQIIAMLEGFRKC